MSIHVTEGGMAKELLPYFAKTIQILYGQKTKRVIVFFFSFSTQLSSFISGNSGILFDDDNLNS